MTDQTQQGETQNNTQTPPAQDPTQPSVLGKNDFLSTMFSTDGAIQQDALSRLPVDWGENAAHIIGQYGNAYDAFAGLVHNKRLASKKNPGPLREGATDAEKAEFGEMLKSIHGTPNDIDGYGVKRPDNIPEELWNDEATNGFLGILHKHNASPDLVKDLVESSNAETLKLLGVTEEQKALAEQQKEKDDMRYLTEKSFGNLKGLMSDATDMSVLVQQKTGITPDDEIWDNPKVIHAMSALKGFFGEDKFPSTGQSNPLNAAQESPRDQIRDMLNNKSNPLYEALRDKTHYNYAKAHAEYMRLVNLQSVQKKNNVQ
jgi:hypothetical protein